MHFDLWTVSLQAINFVILVWLLHRFLYKPVLRMIDARRTEIEQQYIEVHNAEARATAALADVEAQRTGIAAERTAALKAGVAQAEEIAQDRRNKAKQEAASLLEQARLTIATERREALVELRTSALRLAVDFARRLLDEMPTELRAAAWLDRIERHLRGLEASARQEIERGLKDGGLLRVVTAVALPDPVKTEWRARLERTLGDEAAMEFSVDPALIAGVELQFPYAILRFSWRATLTELQSEIDEDGKAR